MGWTYSFDFNIQAVDPSFNVSSLAGWGTVQNTGAVVAGTLDGLTLLSDGSNPIVTVYWAQDGQVTTDSAIQAAPGGPGVELPQLFLIFDTSSATGEVVVWVGGNDTYLNLNWYALFTINKLYRAPLLGSGSFIRDRAGFVIADATAPATDPGGTFYPAGTINGAPYYYNATANLTLFLTYAFLGGVYALWVVVSGAVPTVTGDESNMVGYASKLDLSGGPAGSYGGYSGGGFTIVSVP